MREVINMENKYCKDCAHFHQHYGLNRKRLFRLYCGHCTAKSRIQKRQPDGHVCENFVMASPHEEAFASKEYLSKALIEYFMRLELLPPIGDTEEI